MTPEFYLHRLDICRCGRRRGDHEGPQPQPCPETGCAGFALQQAHDPRARALEQGSAGNSLGTEANDPYEGRTPWPHPSEESAEDSSE
jgi:hypothetical protein